MAHLRAGANPVGSGPRARARRFLGGTATSLLLLLALAGVPAFTGLYTQQVGFEIFEMAALAQAWNILGGYGGLVSLGTAAFVGIGSYTVAVLTTWLPVPVLPAIILAGVAAGAFAAIVSVPMLRMRGTYFTIGTLAVAEALGIWMLNWNALGGSEGIFLNVSLPSPTELYYASLAIAVLTTVLLAWILRTPFGLGLRSVRDNEDVAQEMGVPTFQTKLMAFVVASFVMGVVGGLQAIYLGQVEPTGAFSLRWTIDTVNIAIIGGSATLAGPLVGALFIEGMGQLLANYPEVHLAISGAILIVVIRFAPGGIWGLIRSWWRRMPWAEGRRNR